MTHLAERPGAPLRSFGSRGRVIRRLAMALVPLTVLVAAVWWAVPMLSYSSFVPVPEFSEARLRELKANGVGTARIYGLDARGRAGDVEVRVTAGYMDERQIVLFMTLAPPARFTLSEAALRDQFGRVYRARSSFADSTTGEHIVTFEAPQPPLLVTGARLWLETTQIERERGPQRTRVSLSLPLVLTAPMGPTLAFFFLDMAINYGVMVVAALGYLALPHLAARMLKRREAWAAYLDGVTAGVLFLAIALPTYILIASAFRHDPAFSGRTRELDTYFTYVGMTRVALVVVWVIGVVIAFARARRAPTTGVAPFVSVAAVLLFLVLTLPLVEFAIACYIGTPFLLNPSC